MSLFASAAQVSRTDAEAIRRFLTIHKLEFEENDVLDYGCGKQPYRDIVEGVGGRYYGFDNTTFPDSQVEVTVDERNNWGYYDVVLCTQVLMLVPKPKKLLRYLHTLAPKLVLTVNLGYRQFHHQDLWRWTSSGLGHLLLEAGWEQSTIFPTWSVPLASDYEIVMGLGAIAC